MNKYLWMIGSVFLSILSFAQDSGELRGGCGTDVYLKLQQEKGTEYAKGVETAEENARAWIKKNQDFLDLKHGDITIPVVVHVVYNNTNPEDSAAQYILEERIVEQIEILNDAYRMRNENAQTVRSVFDSVKADVQINFELAKLDPNCQPTTGINYVPTDADGFDLFFGGIDLIKQSSEGGADAWPVDQYFNIWVGNLTVFGGEGLYGIATFPSDMPESEGGRGDQGQFDGVAIYYQKMGVNTERLDDNGEPYSLGYTLVHEAGHYLGLRHIWADEQGTQCAADDYVYDTPMAFEQADPTFSAAECPFDKNTCDNEDFDGNTYWNGTNPPDMIENYMDYSGEKCYAIFTKGQKERMWSFMRTTKASILNNRCGEGVLQSFVVPTKTSCPKECDGALSVEVFNGTAPFQYSIDNGTTFQDDSVFTGLCVGDYDVVVKDALDSVSSFQTKVFTSYVKALLSGSVVNSTCATCADGSVIADVKFGNEPYEFSWSNGQDGDTLKNATPGIYTLTVTDACGEVYTQEFEVEDATGISEMELQNALSMYPNPANEFVTVEFERGNILSIQLIDLGGRLLMNQTYTGISKTDIDVSSFDAGVFILQVETNAGVVNRKLLVE